MTGKRVSICEGLRQEVVEEEEPPAELFCSSSSQTALHWAAKHGSSDMAALVADAGADVNSKSVSFPSPVGRADIGTPGPRALTPCLFPLQHVSTQLLAVATGTPVQVYPAAPTPSPWKPSCANAWRRRGSSTPANKSRHVMLIVPPQTPPLRASVHGSRTTQFSANYRAIMFLWSPGVSITSANLWTSFSGCFHWPGRGGGGAWETPGGT